MRGPFDETPHERAGVAQNPHTRRSFEALILVYSRYNPMGALERCDVRTEGGREGGQDRKHQGRTIDREKESACVCVCVGCE